MYRSGLILGFLTLFVAAGATLISPVCTPCAGVFLGMGVGYLAGIFDKPAAANRASRVGAAGGAIAGVGAILGQITGALLNSLVIGPQGAERIYQALGLPSNGPGFVQSYWMGMVGSTICLSLVDIIVMASAGALGGYLWWKLMGTSTDSSAPPLTT